MANATLMAKAFGKDPDDILKTKTWKEYENAIKEEKGIRSEYLRYAIQGGNNQGTWIHQELTIEYARRCNIKFSIWCNDRIAELLKNGKVEIKPVSQAHMVLQMAQALVAQEERLATVESQVGEILKIQKDATIEIDYVERSEERMPEETLRAKIRKLVNVYCRAKLKHNQEVWNLIYDRLYYRYHIQIKKYKKKPNESWLDVAERNEFLDKIFVIASNELTI
jgi:hypothetical protein